MSGKGSKDPKSALKGVQPISNFFKPKDPVKKEETGGEAKNIPKSPAAAPPHTSPSAKRTPAKAKPKEKPKSTPKPKPAPPQEVLEDEDGDAVMIEDEAAAPRPLQRKAGAGVGAEKRKRAVLSSDDEEVVDVGSDSMSTADSDSDDSDFDESDSDDEVTKKKKKAAAATKKTATKKKPSPVQPPPKKVPKTEARPPASAKKAPASAPRAKKAPPPPLDVDTREAMRLVAAAVAAVKQRLEGAEPHYSVFEGDMPVFGARDEPPMRDSKPLPSGHPECLQGLTFVLTGTQQSTPREALEHLIKRHNGRVTGQVSGKTSFLVAGAGSGGKKIALAKEKEIPIIDEDMLMEMIQSTAHLGGMGAGAGASKDEVFAALNAPPSASPGRTRLLPPPALGGEGGTTRVLPPPSEMLGGAGPGPDDTPSKTRLLPPPNMAEVGGARGAGAARPPPGPMVESELWVEKHKPRRATDLVGNTSVIATLRDWLKQWEAVHIKNLPPPSGAQSRGKELDYRKKAVLMAGPPGIGKTSSAKIIALELGFQVIEVNASDARGKADADPLKGVNGKTANRIKELCTNRSLSDAFGRGGRDERGRDVGAFAKTLIIMDEVDGMSAGDRGGVADLIQTIHKTKMPILCICNDKYSQKLKSLKNHCIELEFRKPPNPSVVKRMQEICHIEGLRMSDQALSALVDAAQGDLRLTLGQLQMIRLGQSSMTYDDAVNRGARNQKDSDQSPFVVAGKLLDREIAAVKIKDRMDLVFQDADLIPLLVQENYLNHRPIIAGSDLQRMRVLAKAAEAFSAGDTVNQRVRRYQNWNLMPFANLLSTVYPASYAKGPRETLGLYPGESAFTRFTAWMGNNSSQSKQKRLTQELHTRMIASEALACDRTALRLDYLPVLRQLITKPLRDRGQDGIEEVVDFMHQYCLQREDLDFIADVTAFKSTMHPHLKEDPGKGVEPKVKAALTRAYNKDPSRARTNTMVEEFKRGKGGGKKKGKGASAPLDGEPPLEGELGEAAALEEEEEEEGGGEGEGEGEDAEERKRRLEKGGVRVQLKEGQRSKSGAGRGGGASGKGAGRGTRK